MHDPAGESGGKIRDPQHVLWIVLILAVGLRVGSAVYQGSEVRALPGVADQISYHELSLRVLGGHGFSFDRGWWPATPAGQPTAHWSFLYVLYLAGVYALFGADPLLPRLIQAVVSGILHPLLAWRIGRRLFGTRVGLTASFLSSVYVYFVFYGGALMTESVFILAFLWVLDLVTAMAASDSGSCAVRIFPWIQLGVACALAALARQVFLLLIPLVLIWVFWILRRTRMLSFRSIAGRWTLTLAVLGLFIAPWTLRNYQVFHSLVLLNTNAGYALFWGNHPIHGRRFVPLLAPEQYASLIPEELHGLNEAQTEKKLLRMGLAFVRADPVRYLWLCAGRAKEYFKFWPAEDSNAISNISRVLSAAVCIPLFLCGLCLLVFCRGHKHDQDVRVISPGVSLLISAGFLFTLLHLMTWALIRYRLPVDAVEIPIAAFAAVTGYDRIKAAGIPALLKQFNRFAVGRAPGK